MPTHGPTAQFYICMAAGSELSVRSFGSSSDSSSSADEEYSDDWAGALRLGTKKLLQGAWDETLAEPPLCNSLEHHRRTSRGIGPTLLCSRSPMLDSCQKTLPLECGPTADEAHEGDSCMTFANMVRAKNLPKENLPRLVVEESAPPGPSDVRKEEAPGKVFVPRAPSAPRPKSASGVRRCMRGRPITMAPMLRAKHMDLLDQQYLKDIDVRLAPKSARSCRSPCRGRRAKSSDARFVTSQAATKSVAKGCQDKSQQRPLGPRAVMPLLKGQLKIQAEAAQREEDKEKREAKLKEQFRLRPPARPRILSRGRTTHVANRR